MTHQSEKYRFQLDISEQDIAVMNENFNDADPGVLLEWACNEFQQKVVLGTGFGPSGVVLMHHLYKSEIPIRVFCLDTGLLFTQTYELWKKLERRFNITIEKVSPILTLEGQKSKYGDKLWESDADRCCHIRKVLPLRKYLANKAAWVTGLRRSQSEFRGTIDKIEWDPTNKVVKINPLADWSQENVWWYIKEYDLPYNSLHDDGFPSIGCIPCTSKASDERDERSGRWKNSAKTECGIHLPDSESGQ